MSAHFTWNINIAMHELTSESSETLERDSADDDKLREGGELRTGLVVGVVAMDSQTTDS